MATKDDITPTGLRIVGPWENDRNAESAQLFKDIIKEAYGCSDVIIAHHLVYVAQEKRDDGFEYQIVEEIPSADSLIFCHDVAQRIWGKGWMEVLQTLALVPETERDKLLAKMYYGRRKHG